MKHTNKLLLIFFLILAKDSNAQNAYLDAVTFDSYITQNPMTVQTYDELKLLLNTHNILDTSRLTKPDPLESAPGDTTVLLNKILMSGLVNPFFTSAGTTITIKTIGRLPFVFDGSREFAFSEPLVTQNSETATVILGIGKFLATRTKEELTVAFFTRFRKFLNVNPEIGQLFPTTVKYLNTILNTNYSNMLSTLRAAFESDIKTILGNIATMASLVPATACSGCTTDNQLATCKKRLTYIQNLFKTEIGRILIAGFIIADGAVTKKNPADMLASIAGNSFIKGLSNELANSIALLNIISTSLRSADVGKIWITKAELTTLLNNDALRNAYLGFVYEDIKKNNIQIGGINIADVFTPANTDGLKTYLTNLGDAITQLTKAYDVLKKQDPNADPTSESVINAATQFATRLSQFLQQAITYQTISNRLPPPPKSIIKILNYSDSALAIAEKLIGKDYYGAFLSLTLMLEGLAGSPDNFDYRGGLKKKYVLLNNQITKFKTINSFTSNKDVRKFISDQKKKISARSAATTNFTVPLTDLPFTLSPYMMLNLPTTTTARITGFRPVDFESQFAALPEIAIDQQKFFSDMLRYGNFLSDVVSAKDPDDVEKALETMALPPGSSSIKKNSNFNIAVQAYMGVITSHNKNVDPYFSSFGVYAPVGISFSLGLRSPHICTPQKSPSNLTTWGSLTLFLSVIDVGAVASYEFQNPDTNTNTQTSTNVDLTWANIFAPGASLVYGIPGLPLSVGFGGQYQARLQKYNASGDVIQNPGFRWNVFLAVDIPVINLYNSKN